MVYLAHLQIGYKDLFFKFEDLENTVAFVRQTKLRTVKELSDDISIRTTIEVLTVEEFNEKIKETEE